ncbi:MAG: protein translocase subunit SecD [Alphaproteobacteria bacterium]|nr:protein translocase subunit SecD [Rickettsiales bacterium]
MTLNKIRAIKATVVLLVSTFSIFVFCANIFLQKQKDIHQQSKSTLSKAIWSFTPSVSLGLDLKGGSQLILSVDFSRIMTDRYSNMLQDLKEQMWNKKIPYGDIEKTTEGIFIKKSDLAKLDMSGIKKVVEQNNWGIAVNKKDDGVLLSLSSSEISDIRLSVMERVLKIVRNRVDESGTKEIVLQRIGESSVLVQVPGMDSPEQLKRLLGRVASLTFHLLDSENPILKDSLTIVPHDCVAMQGYNADTWFNVKRYISLSGSDLTDARVSNENLKVGITFKFNNLAARKFADITELNVGKPLAIVLDNKVLTAPIINTPILGGSGVISGSFTNNDAGEIAGLLRAGSLPAPLDVVEERTIGPSVGLRSVHSAVLAGIVAICGITVFMVIKYKILGIVASIAIILNLTTAITMIAIFGVSLTLPGIAALLLTLGMSVDANVLIYERMRDEVRSGEKNQVKIIQNGFKGSWTGILDSNITTFLAAITMVAFGSGFIRGFAISLIIGIACSLFSAIMFSKLIIEWLFITKNFQIRLK